MEKAPKLYIAVKKPLKFIYPEIVANAFQYSKERKVYKAGCINFDGKKYEVGLTFIGYAVYAVDVIYDPADITELTFEYEGHTL